MQNANGLKEKLEESVFSVLPITLIVIILCFSVVPVQTDLMLSFLIGSVFLVLGLGLFMFGSDMSVAKIGSHIGAKLTESQNILLILGISFLLGIIVTAAEPDLQVLAKNVPHIGTRALIFTVSVGVGFFLMLCMLRILLGIPLRMILLICYAVIFILAACSDPEYLSVAFDAGGVTTGPMTAPFIIAMGIGVASIRSDKNAEADSFGLLALCSVGPILSVLLLGFFYRGEETDLSAGRIREYADTLHLSREYLTELPAYLEEVAVALLPIVLFFLFFQIFALKLRRIHFLNILAGLGFTYAGLVIFLLGVNVGFSSMGVVLGEMLAVGWKKYLLFPVAGVMGWFIISAEPAVHVLTKQVEEVSAGSISEKSMKLGLSVAIACAMMLSVVRVATGIHILWFVLPGYAAALALSFFVSPVFTAIAFDSGGVASGPMSATFMLPLMTGACQTVGGNILTDAFGVVALVALMPLLTIQTMGVAAVLRQRKTRGDSVAAFDDSEVIELWKL